MKTGQSKKIHQNGYNQRGNKDIRLFGKKEKVNTASNDELKTLQEYDHKKIHCCDDFLSTSKSDIQDSKANEPTTFPTWKRVEPIGAATDLPPSKTSPVKPVNDPGKYRWNNNFVRNGSKIELFKRGKFRKFDHVKSKIDSCLAKIDDQKPIYFYAKQHRKADPNHLPKQKQNYSQNTTRQKKLPNDYSSNTLPKNQDGSHTKLLNSNICVSSQKHDQSDISSNQRIYQMSSPLPSPEHSQTSYAPFYGFFVPWQGPVPVISPSGRMPLYLTPISHDGLCNDTQIHPSLIRTVSDGCTSQQHSPAALAGIINHVGPFLLPCSWLCFRCTLFLFKFPFQR